MKNVNKIKANRIVTVAYYTILNRKPDKNGLTHFSKKLISDPDYDETDLAYDLFTSAEYNMNLIKEKDGDNGL